MSSDTGHHQSRYMCLKPVFILGLFVIAHLTGCMSHSFKASSSLDIKHQKYESLECRSAVNKSEVHQNLKVIRTIISPLFVIGSGGLLALPVVAANGVAEFSDNFHSIDVVELCSDAQKNKSSVMIDSSANFGINVMTSGIGVGSLRLPIPASTAK